MPRFEWDASKAVANLAKHGIGFEDAALALTGRSIRRKSPHPDEDRYVSVCRCQGRV